MRLKFSFSILLQFLNGYAKNFTSQIFSKLKKKQRIFYSTASLARRQKPSKVFRNQFLEKGFIILSEGMEAYNGLCWFYLVAKLYWTLCHPMDCSPPDCSVHGISQARILEWDAISFSRGSSRLWDQAMSPALVGGFLTTEPPGKPSMGFRID